MNKNSSNLRKIISIFLLISIVLCTIGYLGLRFFAVTFSSSLFETTETDNTPSEMFEYIVSRPIPEDIYDLQGGGDTWQGYSIWLRFKANKTTIKNLITEDYELVNCSEIFPALELKIDQKIFQPAWQPQKVNAPDCYKTKKLISNEWTYGASHYLLIDWETMTVYFYGVGG